MGITQSEINIPLVKKLKDEDIEIATGLCTRALNKNNMIFDIISRKECNCPEQIKKDTFTLPEGKLNADIMIIGDVPSEIDGKAHTTTYDSGGRLLMFIFDKLFVKRDNIYVTNVCKCYINCSIMEPNESQEIILQCASRFLELELDIVKPKAIITLGLNAANIARQYILGLEGVDDIQKVRGKKAVGNYNDKNVSIYYTHDPAFILSKYGKLYDMYKSELWNDMKFAITDIALEV